MHPCVPGSAVGMAGDGANQIRLFRSATSRQPPPQTVKSRPKTTPPVFLKGTLTKVGAARTKSPNPELSSDIGSETFHLGSDSLPPGDSVRAYAREFRGQLRRDPDSPSESIPSRLACVHLSFADRRRPICGAPRSAPPANPSSGLNPGIGVFQRENRYC